MKKRWFGVSVIVIVLIYLVAGSLMAGVAAANPTVHIVQWGETLTSIARLYGVSVQAIMEANNLTSATIYAGQRLIIPAAGGEQYVVHIVARGESLLSIAARYGVSYLEIAVRNGLTNPNLIYVGQRLIIPGVKPGTPAPTPQPPATRPPEAIVISSPLPNGNVKSPLTVTGWGSAFENVLAVDVLDQNGKAIGQGQAIVRAEFGQYGPFSGTITFTMPISPQLGRVSVYSISPRDGAIEHLSSVTVNLRP